MATTSNDQFINYAGTIDTVPTQSILGTGTWTSSGVTVTGIATTFLTDFGGNSLFNGLGNPSTVNPHPWLLDKTFNVEVRKVREVISDTELILESAFSGNVIAALPVYVVPESRVKQWSIVEVSGTVTLEGITLGTSEFTGVGVTTETNFDTPDPMILNTVSGVAHVTKYLAP